MVLIRKITVFLLVVFFATGSAFSNIAVETKPNHLSFNSQTQQIALLSARDSRFQDDYLKTDEAFGEEGIHQKTRFSSEVISTLLNADKVTVKTENLLLAGSKIKAEVADITAETLKLISDKNVDYERVFSDTSGLLTRTIEDKGHQRETAVASTIAAGKLIFNGRDITGRAQIDNLIAALSSEHDLSIEQIETVKAELTNKEWQARKRG